MKSIRGYKLLPDFYEALMRPQSVAVVGASEDPKKVSGSTLHYLKKYEYGGQVYPVNTKRDSVQGLPAYPSVESIESTLDLAVVVTPAATTPAIVKQCVEKQVSTVVLIPAGFAELNEEGAFLQEQIQAFIRGSRTRVLGPNCVGTVSVRSSLAATIMTGMDQDRFALKDGGISFITQSGAMGAFVFNMCQTRGIGMGGFISTGNEMDLKFGEVLAATVEDPAVSAVLGYIEGVSDGDAFISGLERASQLGKPVGLLKVGRSADGRAAIQSHTGALAGTQELYSSIFQEFGVTPIGSIEAFADWAQAVDAGKRSLGNRISVATTSGGGGVLVADQCEDLGIPLAHWDHEWREKLSMLLPGYVATRNPIDMTGAGGEPEILADVLRMMIAHPATDIALILIGNLERDEAALVRSILDVSTESTKPIVVVWVGGSGNPVHELNAQGIPAYCDPTRALRALDGLVPRRPISISVSSRDEAKTDRRASARELIGKASSSSGSMLSEDDSKLLLKLYGAPVVCEIAAHDATSAVEAAEVLGYPVAVKLMKPGVAHKSDVGGVDLGLSSAQAVEASTERLLSIGGKSASVIIQQMATGDFELILGVKRDPTFGPFLLLGTGGTLAEVYDDSQVLIPPLTVPRIDDALSRLRSWPLLSGYRGQKAMDTDAVRDVLFSLSSLAMELGEDIEEIDINPLIVDVKGRGATIVDAVVIHNLSRR